MYMILFYSAQIITPYNMTCLPTVPVADTSYPYDAVSQIYNTLFFGLCFVYLQHLSSSDGLCLPEGFRAK